MCDHVPYFWLQAEELEPEFVEFEEEEEEEVCVPACLGVVGSVCGWVGWVCGWVGLAG